MVPNLLSAARIVVPAGSAERLDAGDGEGAEGEGADEVPLGDAEFPGIDPEQDEVPQPTTSRHSTATRLLMGQVWSGGRIQALTAQLR
jgi:hypothetical protein